MKMWEVDSVIDLPDDHKEIRRDPVLPDKQDAEMIASALDAEGIPAWVAETEVTPCTDGAGTISRLPPKLF